jgi:prophage maintenance system killer protein
MKSDHGEIILYQSDDGQASIDVRLMEETVWLTQAQMVDLLDKTKQNISLHIRNIFKEGELREDSVVKESLTTAADGKQYKIKYYNLDVVISVGYRVKSKRGTQFRIWATSVLKDHLVRGYSFNQRRLAEKGTQEVRQVLSLLANTLESHELVNDEGLAVLNIVNRYARTWQLLLQYDEDNLPVPKKQRRVGTVLDLNAAQSAIVSLKKELAARGEATEIFGQERGEGLAGILGAIQQTFGGQDLYPGVEEKAANLLYFVIKDHPFTDGNKRIGTFIFLLFLKMNGLLDQQSFSNKALVALTLLIATSDPAQKDLLVRLIVNLLSETGDV